MEKSKVRNTQRIATKSASPILCARRTSPSKGSPVIRIILFTEITNARNQGLLACVFRPSDCFHLGIKSSQNVASIVFDCEVGNWIKFSSLWTSLDVGFRHDRFSLELG